MGLTAAVPLISAGVGALGGLLGGGSKESKEEKAYRLWLQQRQKDQEAQATKEYSGTFDPETGEYIPGSRGRAQQSYEEIANAPGYAEDEKGTLFLSPEEQEAQYLETGNLQLTPEEQAGQYLTDEEQAGIRLTPEYRANLLAATTDPIGGAATRAKQNLLRYTQAGGPGDEATLVRIRQEQGRQVADATRLQNLGLAEQDREAERYLSQERRGTATNLGLNRQNVDTNIARNRQVVRTNLGLNRQGVSTDIAGRSEERRVGK